MKIESARYPLTLVMATFLMGSSFIASRVLLRDFAPFWLVGWRFIVAAVATLPVALAIKDVPKQHPDWTIIGLIALWQTTGTRGLLFLSMQTISAANAAILLFTNPL